MDKHLKQYEHCKRRSINAMIREGKLIRINGPVKGTL